MRGSIGLLAVLLATSVAGAAEWPDVLGADGGPGAQARYPARVRKLERVRWEFRAGVKMGAAVPLADGSLRVMAGGGNVHRLDPETGRSLWAAGGNTRYWNYSGPAVGPDGTAYGGNHGWIFALGPDGELRWRTDLKASWIHRPPALSPDGRTLYVGADAVGIAALDAGDGSVRWLRRDFRSPWTRHALDAEGRLVAAFGDRVVGFAEDGAERWELPGGVSSLLVAGGRLVMSRGSTLFAVDARTRETAFSVDVGGKIRDTALTDEGRIVVSLATGELAQVDLAGRLRWRRRIHDGKISPPATALGGETVVMDAAGVVHLIDSNGFTVSSVATGASFWQWRPSIGPDGRVYVNQDDRLLSIDGAERGPPRRLVATALVATADDFVVDAWVNGRLVPLSHRHLLEDVHGATTERIDVDLREGDFAAFHVVANRIRWGGASFFGVAALDDDGGVAFVSRPGAPWYACDDPAAAPDFVSRRDVGLDRPAGSPVRPWADGPRWLGKHVPGGFAGAPVWGDGGSTFIKCLVPAEGDDDPTAGLPPWHHLLRQDLAVVDVQRTLYHRPDDGRVFVRFRLANPLAEVVVASLGGRFRFYPNSWGARPERERGVVDELRIDASGRSAGPDVPRVAIPPVEVIDWYAPLGGATREEVEAAGGRWIFVGVDGVIDVAAGRRRERLAVLFADDPDAFRRSLEAATVWFPRPLAWRPLPADARIVE